MTVPYIVFPNTVGDGLPACPYIIYTAKHPRFKPGVFSTN